MKPILILYIRLFLFTGILFGLFSLISDLLSGDSLLPGRILYRIIFFGGIMSVTLGTFHILRLKIIGVRNLTSDVLKVKQRKMVKSKLSFTDIINLLKADPFITQVIDTENKNQVTFKTNMSLWSFGERININVHSGDNTGTEYEITSNPLIKTTIVDFGRNYQNVRRIEKVLNPVA